MSSNFKGKKITVMGLGFYEKGTGIEAVKFFLRHGAKVTVTDLRSAKELEKRVRELVRYYSRLPRTQDVGRGLVPRRGGEPQAPEQSSVRGRQGPALRFVFGRHSEQDFKNVDLVFQNPSVPDDAPFLKIAARRRIPIVNDWSIFLSKYTPTLFVGVTGTRGKSTTTALIYEILKRQYSSIPRNRGMESTIRANGRIEQSLIRTNRRISELGAGGGGKVWLAGNLGTSPLAFIDEYQGEPIVAELSSWLLHHFEGVKKSPNVAVVTNIMNDHLDKYQSQREYIADKENILRFQTRKDVAVLNADDLVVRKMARRTRGKVVWFRTKRLAYSVERLGLVGAHNVANVNAAMAVAKVLGVSENNIAAVLKNFRGLPGRLEFTRTVGGVRYYNDTTATTPDATIAALRALGHHPNLSPQGRGKGEGRRIVLIAGGADKKLEYREMAKYIKKYCKAVVLLPGTATEKLELRIKNEELRILKVKSMREAVRVAAKFAKESDIILLSPAAASFGLFKNEFDRGRQFVDNVRNLVRFRDSSDKHST